MALWVLEVVVWALVAVWSGLLVAVVLYDVYWRGYDACVRDAYDALMRQDLERLERVANGEIL